MKDHKAERTPSGRCSRKFSKHDHPWNFKGVSSAPSLAFRIVVLACTVDHNSKLELYAISSIIYVQQNNCYASTTLLATLRIACQVEPLANVANTFGCCKEFVHLNSYINSHNSHSLPVKFSNRKLTKCLRSPCNSRI